ncbi:IS1182 family transposase [uncultured Draconibacterium sp.]|uniref:IS1182 family transposase n=1 Tax=uncultured Draconibacterium sp. TaxID=1573823 RepID=UPI0029C74A2C|nr:IS1182 family transposase [uncultured Draconibacterium sp.]
MKYLKGQNRSQISLFPVSLDQAINADNEVRLIDVFVNSLKLEEFGFRVDHIENGRPAYHPADLLKLYIYGYLNQLRSSRKLEKECKRNIELMWLLKTLRPDHNTIANFRRDNPKAIKKVFRETVKIATYFNLIGGTLIAGDSTKLRAQNSKKNNYNQKKIDRHLEYIENKLAEYNKALAESDGDKKQEIENEIEKQNQRKDGYKKIEQELKKSGQRQISTSDPDSRHQITRNNITEVAYSAQTSVDAKNYIPIDYKITNANDKKAMGTMLRRAKTILRHNDFTALYDKGYHTGSELAIADSLGIPAIVAIPPFSGASHAPDLRYDVEHFDYDPKTDTYTCLKGHTLRTTGYWHHAKNGAGETAYRFRNYTTPKCKSCEVRPLCTKSAANGKQVRRSEFANNIENNKKRVQESEKLYKRRQAIVEHPFGTIKRQWGFNYIITKKYMKRAEADFGFIMSAYNLRRIINIVGIKKLEKYITSIFSVLCSIFDLLKLFLSHRNRIQYKTIKTICYEIRIPGHLIKLNFNASGKGF